MRKVYHIIRTLGVTSKYKGYHIVADAVTYIMEERGRHLHITKELYPWLARKHHTKPANIEQNIRTVVELCWRNNPELMQEIAGCELDGRPSNSEFLDNLAYYLNEQEINSPGM